jgi:hypothetical protein
MMLIGENGKLLSRYIRINAVKGKTGKELLEEARGVEVLRKIGNLTKTQKKPGNPLAGLWNGASAFLGFGLQVLKFIGFSISDAVGWIFNTAAAIWRFDWNATDTQIKSSLENDSVRLAQIWGRFFGNATGWIVGIGVGYGVALACPVIGGAMLANAVALATLKEGLDETGQALKAAIIQSLDIGVKQAALTGYMNFRALLKKAPKSALEAVYGKDGAKFIQETWGRESSTSMSMSKSLEEFIDRGTGGNKAAKAFWEEYAEEAWDGFTEAGFVIAAELDGALSQAKLAQEQILGEARTVEVKLDKQSEEVVHFVNVPQNVLIPQIQQSINQYRVIAGKDIGEFCGAPVIEQIKLEHQLRVLKIQFCEYQKPPFSRKGEHGKRTTIGIPDAKPGVKWSDLKAAMKHYTSGSHWVTAQLANGRQMCGWFSSFAEGKRVIRALAQLSSKRLDESTFRCSVGEGDPASRKTKQMFPVGATLLYPKRQNGDRTKPLGKTQRIDLWMDTEPEGVKPFT